MKRVALHTLGCRLNFAETGSIVQGFVERGYKIVDFGDEADLIFLNTCTVTDSADSTCRNLIRKAVSSSPNAKIVVAGCYAQMESEAIANIPHVALILGTSEKFKVFDYLDSEELVIATAREQQFRGGVTSRDTHTRAFLKIQDGCEYVCSYCIIPLARGRSKTVEVQTVEKLAIDLVSQGVNEIVLTGVNIGEYAALAQLLTRLELIGGLERIRLSSIEPNTLNDQMLQVLGSSTKFLSHLHIPLQSGDDEILRRMKRRYLAADYRETIRRVRNVLPAATIGADIMVGFPGESEEQFFNTLRLVEDLQISHIHIFPYSARKNTAASKMENQIPSKVKKERARVLTDLANRMLEKFSLRLVGQSKSILFEKRDSNNLFWGYTDTFVKVGVESEEDLKNQIRDVVIREFVQGKLFGTLKSSPDRI